MMILKGKGKVTSFSFLEGLIQVPQTEFWAEDQSHQFAVLHSLLLTAFLIFKTVINPPFIFSAVGLQWQC